MVIVGDTGRAGRFELIIGGASEDGVAKSLSVPIKRDAVTEE